MEKNCIRLEIDKLERKYFFECDRNSPLGEIYDVISQMQHYVLEKMIESTGKKKEYENVDSSI